MTKSSHDVCCIPLLLFPPSTQAHSEYEQHIKEADMLESHIIQAGPQAAEKERQSNERMREEMEDCLQDCLQVTGQIRSVIIYSP